MAYTKTLQDADTYFNGSLKKNRWNSFGSDKSIALVQSQRELELYMGTDAEDPETDDRVRWDYAIFEYAYHLLDELPRQHQAGTSKTISPLTVTQKKGATEDGSDIGLPRIVQSYLGLNRIKMVRG